MARETRVVRGDCGGVQVGHVTRRATERNGGRAAHDFERRLCARPCLSCRRRHRPISLRRRRKISYTMNLWLLTCLVTCFLGTWNPAVQAQGVFEDCCLAYNPPIRPAVLHRARSYWCQVVSRSCNLPAVIFHFPHRKINVCGNPQDRWVQNGMKLLDVRNKTLPKHHQCTWKTSQGKNLSSRVSRLKLSALRGHPRSSKKNASLPAPANPGL